MFDIENLRNEIMIEEREVYENDFFSMREILKSEEMNFTIFQHEYANEIVEHSFDCEDYYLRLRDEKLIEEREAYEAAYFSVIEEGMFKKDLLDILIESYEEYLYGNDYDYYLEDLYFDDYDEYNLLEYPDYGDLEAVYCCNNILCYESRDDPFDRLDGCDYPEGPNENLNGFDYFEHYSETYFEEFGDFADYDFDFPEPEIYIEGCIEFLGDIKSYDNDESNLQKSIQEHLEEEKRYLKHIVDSEIRDEHFLPMDNQDIIFC